MNLAGLTFFVGGTLPALATLDHQVQSIPNLLAHDLVIELLGHVLIAKGKAGMRLEEDVLSPLRLLPLQHLRADDTPMSQSKSACRLATEQRHGSTILRPCSLPFMA